MSDFYDRDVYAFAQVLDAVIPEIAEGWDSFNQAVFAPEGREIPLKYRELMAVAVALNTQCPYCIETHLKRAVRAGATRTELAETAWVATALRGGGAYAHGAMMMRLHDTAGETHQHEHPREERAT